MTKKKQSRLAKLVSTPRFRWALFVAYAILLSNMLLTPHPWWIMGWAGDTIDTAFEKSVDDFYQHMAVFVLFVGLLLFARNSTDWPSRRLCIGVALAYSVVTEVIQHFVPNRFLDSVDALGNFSGVALGAAMMVGLEKLTRRGEEAK